MRRRFCGFVFWISVASVIAIGPAVGAPEERSAATPALDTVADILRCVSRNAPKTTVRQTFDLHVHDRAGGVQKLEAVLQWKQDEQGLSKILVRLRAPADLRGSSYLLLEGEKRNDMFAYLPELKLVRRITGRHSAGSVFGSDFSYEDMERLYNLASAGDTKRLEDATIGGRPVYVVETRATDEAESAYHKTVASIDRATCVTLQTVFYENEKDIRKTLSADATSLEHVDGVWIPKRVRIEDRRTATYTELVVGSIDFDVEIPDREFTRSWLERKGH